MHSLRQRIVAAPLMASVAFMTMASAAQADAPTLLIENFVGVVTVTNTDDPTITVTTIDNQGDLRLDDQGSNLTVDGGIDDPDTDDCVGYYGSLDLQFGKNGKNRRGKFGGYKNLEDYPHLAISAPSDTQLIIRNAIPFGDIGDIGSADIDMSGCGNLTLGNIDAKAVLSITGSGDIEAKDIGELFLNIRGSGDFEGAQTGPAKATISGSGDIDLGAVKSGDFRITGSGEMEIGDVNGPLQVTIQGSGDFSADDVTGDVAYEGRGSGDFDLDSVNGRLSIETSGSGNVDINGGNVSTLLVTAAGSGHVDFDGKAETATLYASGSSDINIDAVTGEAERRERGSASIDIGNK